MTSRNLLAVFILCFGISVLVCLTIDIKADLDKVSGISLFSAVMITLFLYTFGKPLNKWFRETFDKDYKYNRDMSLIKKQNKAN